MDALGNAARTILSTIDDSETVDLLGRLVAFRTENPPGDEAGLAQFLANLLRNSGLEVEIDELMPGRANLTARIGRPRGRRLLLNAHTDTMPAGLGWSSPPQQARIRGGRLYGCGACDAKGGLASCVEAILAIKRAGVPLGGEVILDAVVDEEGSASGTRRTIERGRSADWAIVMEPTDLQVMHVGNGQVNMELEFRGIAAHGSAPEEGRNAIADAAAFVSEVELASTLLHHAPHAVLGAATYNVGTIVGGVQTSIVPSLCRVTVDRRIVPGQTPDDALGDVERILDHLRTARPGLDVTLRPLATIRTIEVAANEPIVAALHQAVGDTGSEAPSLGGLRATSDAAQLIEACIPTVVFGPGSTNRSAHRPDEFVPLDELHHATRALALVAVRLLGVAHQA